ncbi:RanBP2-type zinc finger protein [Sesamum angolense]|uniref:RanBP2-type zinc finger protein n=1 Tax=Sesamum angolense TaxID=2727404 RepID=A0AAE2BYQ4_9LAMI|nr:RanBP2-type zinc finger protein [Sesamum angolense]
MLQIGGMYGVPPLMDRYGLGLPMSPTMGLRPGFFPEDKSQKKADGTRDNDWSCPKCGNVNFSFRTVCNMRKCNTPKPGPQGAKSGKNSYMPEGSWKCDKCNNINYPFRTKCNRQNCGADKPSETKKSPPEPAEENDQRLSSYSAFLVVVLTLVVLVVFILIKLHHVSARLFLLEFELVLVSISSIILFALQEPYSMGG